MKIFFYMFLVLFAGFSYAKETIVVGKSNFNDKMIEGAIVMLMDVDPYGKRLCEKVDKINATIIEERIDASGKKISREKWTLSGCSGADEVVITMIGENGLIQLEGG